MSRATDCTLSYPWLRSLLCLVSLVALCHTHRYVVLLNISFIHYMVLHFASDLQEIGRNPCDGTALSTDNRCDTCTPTVTWLYLSLFIHSVTLISYSCMFLSIYTLLWHLLCGVLMILYYCCSAETPTVIQKLFATSSATTLSCKCGIESTRESETFMYNMIYPEAPVDGKDRTCCYLLFASHLYMSHLRRKDLYMKTRNRKIRSVALLFYFV